MVPDSNSVTEEGYFRKEEEAAVLMGIQKQVSFTFEMEDREIQSKLVELETIDRVKNSERERRNGYQ
jgi:hypothetical protein